MTGPGDGRVSFTSLWRHSLGWAIMGTCIVYVGGMSVLSAVYEAFGGGNFSVMDTALAAVGGAMWGMTFCMWTGWFFMLLISTIVATVRYLRHGYRTRRGRTAHAS